MTIAPPDFVSRNPQTVEDEIVTLTQTNLQRDRIYNGEPIRLFIAVMAYRETLVRTAIQFTGEQNLVSYATAQYLDLIGEAFDTARLAAAPAVTTLQFTKNANAINITGFIPAGTRVQTNDGLLIFATDSNLTILSGSTLGIVQATSIVVGDVGNGYAAGTINTFVDPIINIGSVTNTTESNGGSDIEGDEAYRTRLKLASSKFSVAGPRAAYEFWALSADSDVIDVAILGPPNTSSRVQVDVYILATGPALPTTELKNTVNDVLQNNQVRPLTDEVSVLDPTEINYTINASVTLLAESDTASTLTALQSAADAYAADRRSQLGQDIVRNQIIAALGSIDGVYDVTLTQPATDTVVAGSGWANATSVNVTIAGTAEG